MQTETVVGPTPTFTSITIGNWTLRLADAADVSAGDARTAGDLVTEHSTDGVVEVNEAAT